MLERTRQIPPERNDWNDATPIVTRIRNEADGSRPRRSGFSEPRAKCPQEGVRSKPPNSMGRASLVPNGPKELRSAIKMQRRSAPMSGRLNRSVQKRPGTGTCMKNRNRAVEKAQTARQYGGCKNRWLPGTTGCIVIVHGQRQADTFLQAALSDSTIVRCQGV